MDSNLPTDAAIAAQLLALSLDAGLRTWQLGGKVLLPVVQGGMGVGVSASTLAGTVARFGGVGTISSVDLRRRHADLMARTGHLDKEPDAREREILYQHDMGLVRVRRYLKNKASAQLEALAGAKSGKAA